MLHEILLKLELAYQKANIATTMGSSYENLVSDHQLATRIMGPPPSDCNDPLVVCPHAYALSTIEKRKERYGKRILKIYREMNQEQEGLDYLKKHFRMHLNDITTGRPISQL